MSIYPDTTLYVALRSFDDTHHETATDYFERKGVVLPIDSDLTPYTWLGAG